MKNRTRFPCQIFSHVCRRYQITMKVAGFGCVNKQQLLRNFLWLSPQQHFRTLFREANFHANFRKAVIEISLFPVIFRSNIRAAFLTVARIFVLTETIDVSKIRQVRTKFRYISSKSREKHRNSFAFFLHSTVRIQHTNNYRFDCGFVLKCLISN